MKQRKAEKTSDARQERNIQFAKCHEEKWKEKRWKQKIKLTLHLD